MNEEIRNKVQEISNSTKDGARGLTKEQMEILTDKIADFNGFAGNPCHNSNACYQEHTISSTYENGKILAFLEEDHPLKANFYIEGDPNFTEEFACFTIDGEPIACFPEFKISIGKKRGGSFTFTTSLLHLQFIKCCIDAVLKMYENCKLEAPIEKVSKSSNSSQMLFLPSN